MPRPKTKSELLELGQQNFEKLIEFVDALDKTDQVKDFPKGMMNRNIRDVLAHLHHWHILFLEWYKVGMAGKKPAMPAEGYSWKDTPALNKWIHQNYQNKSLAQVRRSLKSSYTKVSEVIKNHTNEELFEKKRYKWTGSTSMGAYLVSSSSSHYDWALKLIKKALQNVPN